VTMTEAEWLACTDLEAMLESLQASGKAGDRKLRLFAVACCRGFWHLLDDAWTRNVVEVSEGFADGEAALRELGSLNAVANQAARSSDNPALAWAVAELTASNPWHAILRLIRYCVQAKSTVPKIVLVDLFGNPFRPVALNPTWLSWNDGTVAKLAQAAYDERLLPSGQLDSARLAVLADAAEEAGCTDADLLGHLRGPAPHVRGCFAVDLLLGKG
jgi:hypothetical protein